MTMISEKFEKQIHRIHQLVEQGGSEITWNDKIPDPDNLDQPRQIDISIKRDGKLTLVECRIRQTPQDVKWIEELIGRRLSLRADAVIAVSNSGFTEGAKLKAKQYGIILRDLQTLTEQEIQSWGFGTRVSLTFFEYKDVEIKLSIIATDENRPTVDDVMADLKKTNTLYRIFEKASNTIAEKNLSDNPCWFTGHFKVQGLSVCGANIDRVEFAAGVRRIIQDLKIPSVVAYDAPDVQAAERSVHIEKVAFGDFEITQSSNKVIVAVDLTPVKCPPNSQFKYIGFDFGRVVNIKSFETVGLPKFEIPIEKIKLGLSIKV
jgi:hypothetical protein